VTLLQDKPIADQRLYQHTVLPNGVEVVNIQDTRTLQAAAAVAVQAGSYHNPEQLPGLAHFCEHMLFLGSEKYPEPNSFNNFMNAHAASHNAYTDTEITNYFIELSEDGVEEGTDRLANFFKHPLFTEAYVEREVNAVNSEHEKNIDNPTWFTLDTMMSISNAANPMGHFSTGDRKTLWETPRETGIDTVEGLRTFFNKEYCAPRLRVVTYSSESLEVQLNRSVVMFSDMGSTDPTCRQEANTFETPPAWPDSHMGKWQNILGNQPSAQMWILFAVEDLSSTYESNPINYIDHMLSYRGVDSFYLLLQDKLGLISGFNTMLDTSSAGSNFFVIIDLTTEGRHQAGLIMDLFYLYLAGVRMAGVDKDLYQSLSAVSKLMWNWTQPDGPSNTASGLTAAMTKFPAEAILWAQSRTDQVNVTLVEDLFNKLAPHRMNVAYISVANDTSIFEGLEVQVLPHYGRQFTVQNMSEVMPGKGKQWADWLSGNMSAQDLNSTLQELVLKANLSSNFSATELAFPRLPAAIEGIPEDIPMTFMEAPSFNINNSSSGGADLSSTNLAVVSTLFGAPPKPLRSENLPGLFTSPVGSTKQRSNLWYRPGWVTFSPKVQIQIALRPLKMPLEVAASPLEKLRLGIYTSLLMEEMGPRMVDLEAAGSSSSLDMSTGGIFITLRGFAPMLPLLANKTLQELRAFEERVSLNAVRYQRTVEERKQSYSSFTLNAVNYAVSDRNLIIQEGSNSRAEMLAAFDHLSQQNVKTAAHDILFAKPLHVTALAMGNLPEDAAEEMVTLVVNNLMDMADVSAAPQEGAKVELMDKVVDVQNPVEIRLVNPKPGDNNDALVLSLIHGVADVPSRAIFGLLGNILSNLAFNELRTERQLGYIVDGGMSILGNALYVSVIVQGTRERADQTEILAELLYNKLMPDLLANMTEEDFQVHKASFRDSLLAPPTSYTEEFDHFWSPAMLMGACGQLNDGMLEYLEQSMTSKQVLVDAWTRLLAGENGVRKKVVVKYFADSVPERLTSEEVQTRLANEGVSNESIALISAEYNRTVMLDESSSSSRGRLVEAFGYLPEDLRCKLDSVTNDTAILEAVNNTGTVSTGVKFFQEQQQSKRRSMRGPTQSMEQ